MADCYQSFSLLSPSVRSLFGIIHIGIGLSALFGNVVVLMIIAFARLFRNPSNIILSSLAMTDFLVGIILQPMHVMQLFSREFRAHCPFNGIRRDLSVFLAVASFSSITLISYDRYIRLSRTVNYSKHMNLVKAAIFVFFCWLIPALFPLLRLIQKDEKIFVAVVSLYCYSNFITTAIIYYYIVKIVRQKKRQLAGPRSFLIRHHIHAAKTVAVLVAFFFFVTAPISLYNTLVGIQVIFSTRISGFTGKQREIFYTVAVTCAMANSGINPIIYYARIPEFRKQINKLFRRNRVAPLGFESADSRSSEAPLAVKKRNSAVNRFTYERRSQTYFIPNSPFAN